MRHWIGLAALALMTRSPLAAEPVGQFADHRDVGAVSTPGPVEFADGTYRVLVQDSHSAVGSDPRLVYRLAIHPEQPDFRLAASPIDLAGSILMRKGAREAIRVTAFRQDGYDGEIHVTAAGLPKGVTGSEVVIGPANDYAILVLTAADGSGHEGDIGFRVEHDALDGPQLQGLLGPVVRSVGACDTPTGGHQIQADGTSDQAGPDDVDRPAHRSSRRSMASCR